MTGSPQPRRSPAVPRVDPPSQAELLSARVQGQYARLPVSLVTILINSALIVPVVHRPLGSAIVLWAAGVVAGALARLSGWAAWRYGWVRLSPTAWGRLHMAGAGLNGLLWGLLPVLFFPALGVVEHLYVSAVLVGMVAGSAAVTIGCPAAFTAFAAPSFLPLLWRLLGSASRIELVTGIMGCVFAMAMWVLSRTSSRNLVELLTQRFRNEALVLELSTAGDELAEVNAGLEQSVRQRTAELVELERRLAESALLASVGSLAAAVAHDINNPLASLLANVRLLEQELTDAGAPPLGALQETLDDVRASADRVRAIVRSLGEVARSDGGRGLLDLRQIVESCLSVAMPELRTRVQVVRDHGEPCWIVGERAVVSQVLLGLILHLARMVPEGEPSGHALHLTTRRPPGKAEATVELWSAPPPGPSSHPDRPGLGADDLIVALSHASVARLGGATARRADGEGFVLTLPVEREPH
jgi:signal transduction histidine kinase